MSINPFSCLDKQTTRKKTLSTWINHPHSLTDKLQTVQSSVELKLISQHWTKPSWWDTYCLHIDADRIFQREIIMCSHSVAYWYARTIIPQPCYDLNPTFFQRLERESLRNLIFDGQEVHRVNRKSYPIDETCIEYHWVKKHLPHIKSDLWVRFSEYTYIHLKSFYLLELLLPELGEIDL